MEQKSIVIHYNEYQKNEGLDINDKKLLESAMEAAGAAYAPYSNFHVGAAVRLSNGEVISANNQENAAYPSGLCAERVAIFYAHAKYPNAYIESLAVTAKVDGKQCESPTYPCGACRQVMAESELRGGHPIKIIIGGEKITQVVNSTDSLLPFVFDNLPK
ncbi:MAG: cytidine deaminase [Bacteroidales bacterium]|jgi:cytidine deaminase|nr:cytidine deaminase [Bacteroidales bacterium]MDP3397666.1 cytidine deaminase [Bacteroidales bacterium]